MPFRKTQEKAEDKGPVAQAHEKSAGAVIFVKEKPELKFLLLHYQAGHWGFAKGNIEKAETELITAQREIKEETGLEGLQFFEGFKEIITYFYTRQGKVIKKEVVFFLAQSFKEHVTISNEHIGYAWLNYDKALAKVTFQNDKDVLKKAHEHLKAHKE